MKNNELKSMIEELKSCGLSKDAELWQEYFQRGNRSEQFTVVNAGLVNAGKSSLFNALAAKEELFPTDDIPKTIVRQVVELGGGVCLMDSPGLDVREADTKEALRAYREADMILVVHNLNTGEYHRNEIDFILLLKKLLGDSKNLEKRMFFIGTRSDLKEQAEDYSVILSKMKEQLQENCGFRNPEIIPVSANRYFLGVRKDKIQLQNASGIPELRSMVLNAAADLVKSKEEFKRNQLETLRAETIKNLIKISNEKQQIIQTRKKAAANKEKRIIQEWKNSLQNIRTKWNHCFQLYRELK